MTEFEAALEFVKDYAVDVAYAVRRNERLDDLMSYRRYCQEHGLQPTMERLSLARDIAVAAREYVAGSEGGLIVADAAADSRDIDDVPPLFLAESLECHGWRVDYLDRPVIVSGDLGD